MENQKKIIIGVAGLVVAGVGVYLLTRKPKTDTTPSGNITPGIDDPSTAATDSLGTQVGNLISSLIGNWNKKNNPNTPSNCNAPADPYTADGVYHCDFASCGSNGKQSSSSDNVKAMQTVLSGFGESIKGMIDTSGGIDGWIGPGFKQAYNTARKSCLITGIADLKTKAGI